MTTLTAATPSMGGGMVAGARVQPSAPAGGMTGSDIIRIIRQRLVMIILLWLLVMAGTAVLTFVMVKYYPTYAAQAYVQVQSVDPINPLQPLETTKTRPEEMELILRDQALLAESQKVLADTLEDREVSQTRWHREAQEEAKRWNESTVDLLDDAVSAVPARDTSFLVITARAKWPEEAALLANTVVGKYLDKVKKTQKDEIRESKEQLDNELDRAKKELKRLQDELDDFRREGDVLGQGTERNETLATLQALSTELELDALAKQTQWESLRDVDPRELTLTPDVKALVDQDPAILLLERNVQDAEQRLNLFLESGYGSKHKAVEAARSAYNAARSRLDEEQASKVWDYKNQMIAEARRNHLEAMQMLLQVQEQLNEAKAEQRDRDGKMTDYLRKLEERDMARATVEQLQQNRDFVNMTLRASRSLNINIASEAVPPKRRTSPRWEIWMPAGGLLGLALSVGLALLLDIVDKSVRTPRDIARHVAIPVLGTIPTSDDDEIEIERVETAAIDAPQSIVAEAFRRLRANLFFSAPAEQQGVLMVTSPSAENGKTTVAANLAISIALSGRRVLLVDANFRRPAIPGLFGKKCEEGLSNVLIGQSRLDAVVASTHVPGLDVMGAGPTPPNPAELLGSSYLRDLVVDARSRYDQVIFDGPPVLLVSDASVLAGAVDGVLIVCQYRATSRGALLRARSQLEAINSRVFGVVLNMVETRAGGYFRKQYREFYEYQPSDEGGESISGTRQIESDTDGPLPPAPPPTDSGSRRAGADSPRTHSLGAGRSGERPDVEPEPDFLADAEPEPLLDDASAERGDDVGDVQIDESLGLGSELDEDGPIVLDDTKTGKTDADPLDFGDDFRIDLDMDEDLPPGTS